MIYMAGKVMTPSAICNKPLIRPGCIVEIDMTCPTNGIDSKLNKENEVTSKSKCGNLLLWGFWDRRTDCIVDVCVMDTAVKSYCKLQAASRQSTQVRQKKVPQGIPQVMMLFHPFHLLLRMEMLVTCRYINACLSISLSKLLIFAYKQNQHQQIPTMREQCWSHIMQVLNTLQPAVFPRNIVHHTPPIITHNPQHHC
jgi:hypothetical protein